ncbi:MAG: hypothetical protein ACLR6B_06905 [Blautia sp.]
MKDDYISTLRRNARLARECKEQAEEAKALAGGHCRDEAELYLKASDYYRKMWRSAPVKNGPTMRS